MVMKKIILFTLILLISLFSPLNISAKAFETYEISGFNSCDKIFLQSDYNDVYAYGVHDNTIAIFSINSNNFYSVPVSGKIKSYPVLNDKKIYCVYQDEDWNYNLIMFDTNDNKTKIFSLGKSTSNRFSQLVVSDSSYFLLTVSSHIYVSEYNFDGKLIYEYKFENKNVNSVFMNDGEIYATLSSGDIYNLKNGTSLYCTTAYPNVSLSNVGDSYLTDNENRIYSLKENKIIESFTSTAEHLYINGDNIFYSAGNTIYLCDFSGAIIKTYNSVDFVNSFVVADNKVYIISDNNSRINVVTLNELSLYNSGDTNNQNIKTNRAYSEFLYKCDGDIIYDIPVNYTIVDFKAALDQPVKIFDKDGKELTSGKLKTGYIAEFSDKKFTFSVNGDITGTGTVNSRDMFSLMDSFTCKTELFGAYKKAADYNLDGCVDNKDLLLISREMD